MPRTKMDASPELTDKIARASGVTPSDCYQCGKCSAGCPMAPAMDLLPRQIVRCIQLGQTELLLSCKAIWLCVGCHACVDRCPNRINIPRLMENAKYYARAQKLCAVHEVDTFNSIFMENLKNFGRSQEAILEGAYNLGTGSLLQDMTKAPHMLRHGLVSPGINAVEDRDEVRRIIARAQEEDEKC